MDSNTKKVIFGILLALALILGALRYGEHRTSLGAPATGVAGTSSADTAANAPISGVTREQVVNPIIASCTQKLKANPQTANLPVAYVSAWCSCNANELADHMTTQDVADLQSGARSQAEILTAKAEAAVTVCTLKVKLDVTGDTVK